jgi:hypothetical protein
MKTVKLITIEDLEKAQQDEAIIFVNLLYRGRKIYLESNGDAENDLRVVNGFADKIYNTLAEWVT